MKKDLVWLTIEEKNKLLQEGKIKEVEGLFLARIYPRPEGETIDYHLIGREAQEECVKEVTKMAMINDSDMIFYNHRQRVSTKCGSIIIGMNFEFYRLSE